MQVLAVDPHANLAEQDRILYAALRRRIPALTIAEADRLTELREALRDWITPGGSSPDWTRHLHAAAAFTRYTTTEGA